MTSIKLRYCELKEQEQQEFHELLERFDGEFDFTCNKEAFPHGLVCIPRVLCNLYNPKTVENWELFLITSVEDKDGYIELTGHKPNETSTISFNADKVMYGGLIDIMEAIENAISARLQVAMDDYFAKGLEPNFYAVNLFFVLSLLNGTVDVESIWRENGKYYLHCDCQDFEGDIEVSSLSYQNQLQLSNVLEAEIAMNAK